jgi:N-succinyldiaminopimelate aminotransferase
MPRFPAASQNAATVTDSVYTQLGERASRSGFEVAPLHVGDTYLSPPAVARAEHLAEQAHPGLHRYAPVQGVPELLRAIQARLLARSGLQVPLENLQVMAGATAGLNVVGQVLFDPGDEMLLPAPFWPLARGIAAVRGAKAVEVPFFTELGRADFDPEAALERAVTERTVAIYVNTPHNPTSQVLSDDVLAAIGRVAARHDLWILADEAYQDLWLGDAAPEPIYARPDFAGRTIASHTLSKSYGYAGGRVGYTHGPREVMAKVRGMQTFMTYGAPTPMQVGATRALSEGDAFLAECRALYAAAGREAARTLSVAPPAGGTFLFVDVAALLPPGAPDCTPILERCADQGVLLTPGRACGEAYPTWVRLCFTATAPAPLRAALARIAPIFGSARNSGAAL